MSMFSKALKTSVILGVALALPPLADAQAQKGRCQSNTT